MYVGSSVHKNQTHGDNTTKVTKIFLSDKHSGTVKDCGIEIPCAPPATPTPGKIYFKFQIEMVVLFSNMNILAFYDRKN